MWLVCDILFLINLLITCLYLLENRLLRHLSLRRRTKQEVGGNCVTRFMICTPRQTLSRDSYQEEGDGRRM
jgi:hypothetical protein